MESPDAFFGTHVTQPFFTNQRLGTARLLFRPDYRLLKPKTLRKAPAHFVHLMPVHFVVRSLRHLAPEQGMKNRLRNVSSHQKSQAGSSRPNAQRWTVSRYKYNQLPHILRLFSTLSAREADLLWDFD
jgi:hypothetical protein